MKIKLIWIGKPDGDIFDEAIRQYTAKIAAYLPYETVAIPYLKNAKSMPVEEQKKREGELILKKIESDEYVVLWDERGKDYHNGGQHDVGHFSIALALADYISQK